MAQNLNLFMIFYLMVLLFPFAVMGWHGVLTIVDSLRNAS
jgi:hypothetical protein